MPVSHFKTHAQNSNKGDLFGSLFFCVALIYKPYEITDLLKNNR